ncbi:hypothetical protein DPMN_146588 [Dreissena polymorpha]|uniref:Uncharacterized protein n=1 Tax=Dreissena polymorpha TaxID=45954 RepID=A0A9D4J283_DREPO|nr:hypothetical protein DPMN_146588 [Dreissena polymorpha]
MASHPKGRHMTMQTCSTCFTTGSKAEGLTRIMEKGVDSSNVPWGTNIFRSCSRLTYPGHCILLLERYGILMPDALYNALCDDVYGREFLSSDLYVDPRLNIVDPRGVIVSHERAGPSFPTSSGGFEQDLVFALHFDCPRILTRWAARPRNWPSLEVVKEVVSLGAFVSYVGVKGSDYEHVEWRICFNTGENVVINNLNDTQKLSWIATINTMMEEGPWIILRLPKIRQALIAHPEPLRLYSGKKIEMEMLELIHRNRFTLGMYEGTTQTSEKDCFGGLHEDDYGRGSSNL